MSIPDHARANFQTLLRAAADRNLALMECSDAVTGDPQQVILFVQRCAEAFGLTGRWGFQWANTCSRPRVNAFGGGAHVLDLATRQTVSWTDTNGWLARTLAAPRGKRGRR